MIPRQNVAVTILLLISVAAQSSCGSFFSRFISHRQDGTCAGKCDTLGTHPDWPCQCNKPCVQFGDCCPDYQDACLSCADRCDVGFNADFPCQCTSACPSFNNCCPDFNSACDGGTSDGVTDADLRQLGEDLLAVDVNNFGAGIQFDLQGSTSGSDAASGPLFTAPIPDEYLSRPTVAALLNLLDNYNPFVTDAESFNAQQEAEIDTFLDAVFDTEVFAVLTDFVISKGVVNSEAELRDTLREIWFTPYCRSANKKQRKNKNKKRRQCAAGSSGFEHVFIGEQKSNSVSGVHGWISFALQEQEGRINYFGHMTTVDLGDQGAPIELSFTWDGLKKPISSIFVGASPEFEVATLSICFLTRPDSLCPMSLAGQEVKIQTYREAFNGLQLIGSAYFDVSN